MMWGVNNAGVIKKGLHVPILLFCFGSGGIFLSIVLLLDGEFEESPGLALIGIVLGIILIVVGTIRIRKNRRAADGLNRSKCGICNIIEIRKDIRMKIGKQSGVSVTIQERE